MKNVVTRLFKSHGNKIIFFCNDIYMQHFPLACLEYSCSPLGLANLFSVSDDNSLVFFAAKGQEFALLWGQQIINNLHNESDFIFVY